MPSYAVIADFPKVADFRFTEVNDPTNGFYTNQGGFIQFDQKPINDSSMWFMTPKEYYFKRTYTDTCTVIINTEDLSPVVEPSLWITDSTGRFIQTIGGGGGLLYFGNVPAGTMTYVDPVTLASNDYAMRSHRWQFKFNQIEDPITSLTIGNGIYYLNARVYSPDTSIYRDYKSDAIFLYDKFLGTVLIEGRDLTNRSSQGVVAGGWSDGNVPTFQHRVEGCIWDYDPNGVYTGYLQQQYLYLQQNAINFRTWIFSLGTNTEGVPAQVHEKVNEALSTDYWTIDGKPFQLNKSDSDGVSKLWETNDPKLSINRWASTPIRERYSNQHVFVTVTPTPDLILWTIPDPATPYAVADYIINTGSMSVPIARMVFYNSTDEDTYIAAFAALYPSLGGSLLRSAGKMFYVPAPSETPSIFGVAPRVLTTYMELKYRPQVTGGAGFGVAGSGSLQVIDWGDSSAFEQYEYFTGVTNYQTHTYTAMVGYRTATVFHNNDIGTLQFDESGFFYPAVTKIVSILGDLPDGVNTIIVGNCLALGIDNSNIAQIDLTNCPLIYYIQFINCTVLLGVDTALLFPAPQPSLRFLYAVNCAFTSTNVDTFVNDFAVDSWNGTVGGGTIAINGGTSGAPTAASLTNRNLLLAATPAWSLTFNP
jgi:hypothetical protein